jgi:hypothetical protein
MRAPTTQNRREQYEAGNRQAARVILSDIALHGGETSLAVEWARRFVTRVGVLPEPEEQECPVPAPSGQQTLFPPEAA